jgi:hypothetical protein
LDVEPEHEAMQDILKAEQPHIWGVSCGQNRTEHLEMRLTVAPADMHIAHRLEYSSKDDKFRLETAGGRYAAYIMQEILSHKIAGSAE